MKWDLTRLYQSFSDPAFAADMAAAEKMTDELAAKFASPKADTLEQLKDLINSFNALQEVTAKLRSYVSLTLSTEAENEEALAVNDKMMAFFVRIRQRNEGVHGIQSFLGKQLFGQHLLR